MKKIIIILIVLLEVLTLSTGCSDKNNSNTNEHIHRYSSDWKNDKEKHWNECECGEKYNINNHSLLNGKCSICDYSENMLSFELIGNEAYEIASIGDCKYLDIVIPHMYKGKPVISIGENAFAGCNITSVTIPESVTSIGENAFYLCNNLEGIYYTGNYAYWESIIINFPNNELYDLTIYYYSETEPIDTINKYWHYVDNKIVIWE